MIILIGLSSGVGKELVRELIKYDDILATYNQTKVRINTKNSKNKLFLKKLDISDEKKIKKFVRDNLKILKNITFINLAAISIDKLIPNLSSKDINKVFQINTFSNIFFVKFLLPIMIRDNYGRYIFFTSTRASKGDVGISLYASSKSSISSFSRCISKEYGRFKITSNVVSLGYFNSPLLNSIKKNIKEKLINEIPSKKVGQVKNISNIINAIMKSNYVNGAEIKIDGGI